MYQVQRKPVKWSGAHEPPWRASYLPDPVLPFCTPESPACQRRKRLRRPAAPHGREAGTAATQPLGGFRLDLEDRRRKLTVPKTSASREGLRDVD